MVTFIITTTGTAYDVINLYTRHDVCLSALVVIVVYIDEVCVFRLSHSCGRSTLRSPVKNPIEHGTRTYFASVQRVYIAARPMWLLFR